ncbi:aromatic amino acid lyase, partial [Streptomyces hirsutus]|uniref:aromatic amino acid lyase n=1 Tax=Streptomyces hirsutus TaxID=35620 RepID=UPI00364BC392
VYGVSTGFGALATRHISPELRAALQRNIVRSHPAGPQDVGNQVVTQGGGQEEPDLCDRDPIAFEALVADLFRAMGMQAVTTQRSNDGGSGHVASAGPLRSTGLRCGPPRDADPGGAVGAVR